MCVPLRPIVCISDRPSKVTPTPIPTNTHMHTGGGERGVERHRGGKRKQQPWRPRYVNGEEEKEDEAERLDMTVVICMAQGGRPSCAAHALQCTGRQSIDARI